MKFQVERNWVDVVGKIWMPNATWAQRIDLDSYAIENMLEDLDECESCGAYHRAEFGGDCRDDSERFTEPRVATRGSVERWLATNAGDFSSIQDFHAVVGEVEIEWETEEGEMAFNDRMYAEA
jgi:hypothetical protein